MKYIGRSAFAAFVVLSLLTMMALAGSKDEPKEKVEATEEVKKEETVKVTWLTDFEKAKEKAQEKDLAILVNFSGSDWCTWCIRLDEEVLEKDAFKEYASENLVLFVADFPRHKEQDEETMKQNRKLAQQYGIQGFPTVLVVDSDGETIGRTGYRRGGAEDYVKHLKTMIPADTDDGEKE
ncbi:MAG: thioredoxin family protein [Candidatus Sumerlaeia bacterium]